MLSWAWTCYSHRGPCKGWESALGLSAIDAHSTGMKRGTCRGSAFARLVPPRPAKQHRGVSSLYNQTRGCISKHIFLGLLIKIKVSFGWLVAGLL